jgi:hypothetical protein
MTRSRIVGAALLIALYLAVASVAVYVSYQVSPPTTADQFKEFGVRAGIALSAIGAFFGAVFSVFTLAAQVQAARDLEEKKREIIVTVEERKAELQEKLEEHKTTLQTELEQFRASMARQNDWLSRTLDAKSTAQDRLFVAATSCYRELQNLARGEYDRTRVVECERMFREAEGLSAHLDDEDRAIAREVLQVVLNVADAASIVDRIEGLTMEEKRARFAALWNDAYAKVFGDALAALHKRSLFRGQPTGTA